MSQKEHDAWEELDVQGHFFGVFNCDDYTADPLAIFPTVEDAWEWLRFKQANPDEDRAIYGGDFCVLVVRDLSGKAWNHMDPAPGSCRHEVELPGGGRAECGDAAESEDADAPKCVRHADGHL